MRIVRVLLLTGAEVAGRATGAQSAPLTPNPLSPSAGRGWRTRKGGVLQPLLGLIMQRRISGNLHSTARYDRWTNDSQKIFPSASKVLPSTRASRET